MQNNEVVKRPPLWMFLTDSGRALIGLGYFLSKKSKLEQELPKGDGHPVLVLPGFFATDFSTIPLRNQLNTLGYASYPWGLGRNLAKEEYEEQIYEMVEKIYTKHQQKVSIIGWSLGGVFAREVARKMPKKVRQVITLSSPFNGLTNPTSVSWFYTLVTGKRPKDTDPEILERVPQSIQDVPVTAIYSKTDGVVPWQSCVEQQEDALTQNIHINGCHTGLGFNPKIMLCIADRLAQEENKWEHFSWDAWESFTNLASI